MATMGTPISERSWLRVTLLILSTAAVLAYVTSVAWIGEDALITFRVIDNFVNGYGLRWHIDERVQVYTHPLWLFVNAAPYAITREIPYTLTTVSLVFTATAFFLVAWRLLRRSVPLLLGFFIAFVTSKSIVLYGTSGFESPLAYLLFAVYTLHLVPQEADRAVRWGWLGFCAGLASVNRLDHFLLYAPSLAYLCVTNRRQVKWRSLLLGMAPLVLWLAFSLLYYGSFIPNTARAKLSPQIPLIQYVHEGILYTANLIRWDPVSAPILVITLATGAGALVRAFSKSPDARAGRIAALSAGIFLYGVYILRIGGGFLSGRFWAVPLFGAILVIMFGIEDLARQLRRARTRVAAVFVVGVAVVLFAVYGVALGLRSSCGRGEIFERSRAHLYLKRNLTWGMTRDAEIWQRRGLRERDRALETPGHHVIKSGVLGFKGVAAGREVTFVDPLALADPLLARLPLKHAGSWRIGHLRRAIPPGYIHARQTDSLDQMDPSLREYYRHVRLVVSGPIFDWKRLRTMVNLELGRYDHLLEQWRISRGDHDAGPKEVSDDEGEEDE